MRLQCPNCHCGLDVVADPTTIEVTCPSCGSDVDLQVGAETTTYAAPKLGYLGPFQLLEHVGRGHFGDVFKAHDSRLQRVVAVKVPRTADLTARERDAFIREARTAAKLRHPNIVTVHEVETTDETIYIASEFIDGANLADLIAGTKLEPRRAAEIAAAVADALHHAHEQGIIHRDLKPRNIMLDAGGLPHLLDFGLAKHSATEFTITSAGDILGTPAYMAPEQARGDAANADARTDVYALGVTLYEMLTGKRPFEGNVRGLLYQILHDEARPPRELAPAIPRDLETICQKAMSKRPGERYATAADLATDLRRFLSGQTIFARRAGVVERSWKWCRRNPAWAASGSLALMVFALLGLAAFPRATGQTSPPRRPVELDVRLAAGPFQHEDDPPAPSVSAVFWPLDREGTPQTDRPICVTKARPPLRARLEPGHYLVVVVSENDRFHEVQRYVPAEGELVTGRYRHAHSELRSDGVIVLPTVSIPPSSVARGMASYPGAADYVVGDQGTPESPPHHCKLPSFLLDVREVSVDDLRAATKLDDLIRRHNASPAENAAADVTWDEATAWAEYAGKRLPTEVEYEFAATGGGRRPYPWVGSRQPPEIWDMGAVGEPGFDVTDTNPPVRGLYSNVAEWTATWLHLYPAHRALGIPPALEPRDWRVVRGAAASVLMENATASHLGRGPAYRHMMLRGDRSKRIGFRCARSAAPRLNSKDFEVVLPLEESTD